MAKEFIVASWDDKILAESDGHEKVPATRTAHVGFDGDWFEIDLTEDNYSQLRSDLDPWVEIGHKPDTMTDTPYHPLAPGARKTLNKDTVRYRRELREFADKNGLSYRTETGKYYYSVGLRNAYQSYLAGAPESEWRAVLARGGKSTGRRRSKGA